MSLANKISRRTFTFLAASSPLVASVTQDPFTITDNVSLVLLDASVKDQHGSYVTDLPKEAFHLSVDGHQQMISQFSRVDAPVTIGLIVDSSGSMRFKRPEVVLAGLAFAKESNPKDEFFVVNFNNFVEPGLPRSMPFTDNIGELHRALFMGQPAGQTALYDAIAFGLKQLEMGHRDQRTLIVVSDGGDNVSQLKEANILSLIEQSRATVYTVGLFDPNDGDLKPAILKKFAGLSGGEFFEPEKLDDVVSIFGKISKDIRSRYSIGFSPDSVDVNKPVHSVRVTAKDDGRRLQVRSRTAFTLNTAVNLQETSLRDWR